MMNRSKLFMPRKKAKKNEEKQEKEISPSLNKGAQKGIVIVALLTMAVIAALSLFDAAGRVGEGINTSLIYVFGYSRFLIPLILAAIGYVLLFPEKYRLSLVNYLGIGLLILSVAGLLNIFYDDPNKLGGGKIGLVLSYPFVQATTVWVAGIIIIALGIISLLLIFNTSLAELLQKFPATSILGRIGRFIMRLFGHAKEQINNFQENITEEEEEDEIASGFNSHDLKESDAIGLGKPKQMELIKVKKRKIKIDVPLDLLNERNEKPTSGDIKRIKEIIHHTLASFGIETTMGDVSVGPTVTQYTLKPADGVKLSHITTLNNDLALALAAHPIRIEAPIPGKSLVGIEVPNQTIATVGLKTLLESDNFKKRKNNLTVCLGKDVAGETYVADLDSMPHLLIAGATGSGKSVCINSIIMSLLFQNGPDDLKLILVDPKRVEFTLYNDIPHLLTPVITDTKKTINALKWIVSEMDRRYELLSQSGRRNIQDYNSENGNSMPYLVLVIDELADLMATAAREVEAAITRLAQMARAVGIHLVLATQRPSVDVITGLIKANITSRAAFNVASIIDSRTILDHSGAEKLLGRGDMLYISAQLAKPVRLQGAYLLEEEIERVVNYLKDKAKPKYNEEVTDKQTTSVLPQAYQEGEDDDELVAEAKEIIIQAKKASASLLQRRLRVGYARAARILDILEEQGFIGPADGAKPREILVDIPDNNEQYSEKEIENNEDEQVHQ
jgi:S-DNA-T family DNA segregation ATPase FtsK/SpoIIIE